MDLEIIYYYLTFLYCPVGPHQHPISVHRLGSHQYVPVVSFQYLSTTSHTYAHHHQLLCHLTIRLISCLLYIRICLIVYNTDRKYFMIIPYVSIRGFLINMNGYTMNCSLISLLICYYIVNPSGGIIKYIVGSLWFIYHHRGPVNCVRVSPIICMQILCLGHSTRIMKTCHTIRFHNYSRSFLK